MKSLLLLLLLLPPYLNAQVQIYLDLSNDIDSYGTIQTLSKPFEKNPFTTFEYAFVANCIKKLGKDAFVFEDSITYKFSYEKIKKKRLHKQKVGFREIVGISVDVDLIIQNDKLNVKQQSINPIFDVTSWREGKKKERQLFTLKPERGFVNKEYSFLIGSKFKQDDLPKIRDRLYKIFDGGETDVLLNGYFKNIDLASIKESMTVLDTFIVNHCYSPPYGEKVMVSKTEYFFDDLEISIISELNYCSESNAFDIEVLYYGMTLPIIDAETGITKYYRRKFLVPNKGTYD